MKLHRDFTNKINWILDNLLPPIIRDNKIFMSVLLRILYGDKFPYYLTFKDKMPFMTDEEISRYYKDVADVKHNQRETDLNTKCINAIIENLVGDKILDIACGRGFLSKKIALDKSKKVVGIDIIPPEYENDEEIFKNIMFIQGNIENIPFDDKYFDTVVCAHTLEHTMDLNRALSELRRVTKKRLIIVLPKQREYKYTFDFHIHFFPYAHSLLKVLKPTVEKWHLSVLDGDFFYYEDNQSLSG